MNELSEKALEERERVVTPKQAKEDKIKQNL